MMQFIQQHRTILARCTFVLGILVCLKALLESFTYDALHLALIRSGEYNSFSRLYAIEGILGGLLVGLTARSWQRIGKVKGVDH
jgi:hypothetical protein